MVERKSINGECNRHRGMIPNASKMGNLVVSSVISGFNAGTYDFPEDFETEVDNVLAYIKADVEAAGGTLDNVVKTSFWLSDPDNQRSVVNARWAKIFSDPDRRPARHIHQLDNDRRGKIHADFIALL